MTALSSKQIIVKRICCSIIGICESNISDEVFAFRSRSTVVEDLFDALVHLDIDRELIKRGESLIGLSSIELWTNWVNDCVNAIKQQEKNKGFNK